MVKGMGGAMDLVHGAKRVIVADGARGEGRRPKIVQECTLPLTGKGCRRADHHRPRRARRHAATGSVLRELAPGVTVDDVRAATGAPVRTHDGGA